ARTIWPEYEPGWSRSQSPPSASAVPTRITRRAISPTGPPAGCPTSPAETSRQEVQASMSHSSLPMLLHNQILFGGPDTRTDFGWLVPASDGEVYFRTVETSQWDRLVEWMGSPDWAVRRPDELPLYYSAPELIAPLLGEWTGQPTKAWLLEEAVRRRVPVAPSREIAEVLSWAHLRYRNAWELVDTDGGSVTAPRVPLLETVFPGQAMAT